MAIHEPFISTCTFSPSIQDHSNTAMTIRHDAMNEAAYTLSMILNGNHVGHAYIGGFALNLLGSDRETSDIDVLLDVDCPSHIHSYVTPILCGADSRFAVENYKLYFGPARIPIELLTCGMLNLPRRLSIMPTDTPIFPVPLPILPPGVLILTKIKRASHYIGSTRPQSVFKYNADVRDIFYLLLWLQVRGEKIDFESYDASDPRSIYRAFRAIHDHWRDTTGQSMVAPVLNAALQRRDRDIVFGEEHNVSEIIAQMPNLSM
ncbi:hypothetical protein KAF25_005477 [Fusarium avenaceum]|uniref:Uncharacterized protein n=1 Tax=Fusarium avenaceum TaxID=40199 RepID=A0A9P7H505_9HYPO|nr:hypothetical protein KAF25_005477 [Fusarium avenaceum]